MAEDRVTITADASQYFDVLSRAGAASDRFARSGDRIGAGFIRGERVVRTATANIAGALTMSGDAATTVLVAMQGLERVFQIGLGPTIAVAAGVKAFEVLHEQVKRTNDAYKDLKDELSKPLNVDPVTAAADTKIDELTGKIKKLTTESESFGTRFARIFSGLGGALSATFLPSFLQRGAAEALGGIAPVGPGAVKTVTDAAGKRLVALADQRGQAILQAADKLHQALSEAAGRFRSSTGNLFRDIGSGQFTKDQHQRNLENQQAKFGQSRAAEFEDAIAKGIAIGPDAADIVNAARGAAAKGGVGIDDILTADFSNLDTLSKYDFSGLAPLSGITISIQ